MRLTQLRTPADIGALIKVRRRELGLDQADLARQIGVSRLWVNQVERGRHGASLGLILRALGAVGVDLMGDASDGTGTAIDFNAEPVVAPDIDAIVANARGKGDP